MGPKTILLAMLVIVPMQTSGFGEIITAGRRIAWSGDIAGVPGGIPNRMTIFANVTQAPYNADNTGATDASTAIQTALNACPAGQVVYMPSGKFRINSKLNFGTTYYGGSNGKVLSGAGPDKTILLDYISNGAEASIEVGTDLSWASHISTAITSVPAIGSTIMTVASSSGFHVGELVMIDQDNDPNLVWGGSENGMPDGLRTRLLRQTVQITAINGNVITFTAPSIWNWSLALNPKMSSFGEVNGTGNWKGQNCGLENFSIDRTHSNAIRSIFFTTCVGCWTYNVKSILAPAYHFEICDSCLCTIKQCTAYDAQSHGRNGSGIIFYRRVSSSLVEDNIVYRCYPGIEVDSGSGGNIIAYNYMRDDFTDSGLMGASFDPNHGAHTCMDLYEGNVGAMCYADGYYGSSSHITLFRNFFHGTNEEGLTQNSSCVNLARWSLYFNVVGNVLGTQGFSTVYSESGARYPYTEAVIYRLGYPQMDDNYYTNGLYAPPSTDYANALDERVQSSLILHGNYDCVTSSTVWDSNITDRTLPASLYLTSKPAWFGNLAWPPIGPDLTPMTASIPAQARFLGIDYNSGPQPPTGLRVFSQ
jgi:hypothetical protein